MDQTRTLFVYLQPFHNANTNMTINDKTVDIVLEIRTRGARMAPGADEPTELWRRHPYYVIF